MAIDLRVDSLEIRNFRGLRNLGLAFEPGAPMVLIGANNSGKSTILESISLALSGPASYNFTAAKYDFFHDAAGSIADSFELTMRFSAPPGAALPAVRGGVGDPMSVHGARVRGTTSKGDQFSHDIRLVNQDGEPILLPSGVPLKGAAKERWKEHSLSYRQRYARWSDISDYRPDVWLLRSDNLYSSLYQWKTGPLKRLAKLLTKQFFDAAWTFPYEGKPRPMPESLTRAHRFFVEAVREFPFWRDDMKPKLQETLSLYVGRHARIEINPDIREIEEWLADQLVLAFAADAGGAITPLDKMGTGWQSLVRLAALDVLSQYQDETGPRVVLLFEEPESFLHPHLGRKLRGVLDRLAEKGWAVIMATHSPNLVSFSGKQSIVRLARNGDHVTAHTLKAADAEAAAKFQERLDERGAHEMLFAQKAVLCEGQDDVFAVRSHLQKRRGLDLDGRSVSVIRAGDVGQLPGFAAMAGKLGIPWFAISDEDRLPDGSTKPTTAAVRTRLDALQSPADAQGQWCGDLEGCLGKARGKADPEWQANHIEPKSAADVARDHPGYSKVCEQVGEWILK